MKQAEIKEEEKQVEQEEMKMRDLSEWKTNVSEKLKQKGLARPKIIYAGYTNINSLQSRLPVAGRRVFGEKPEKVKPVIDLGGDDEGETAQDKPDLDALWKKDKQQHKVNRVVSNKRNYEDSPKQTSKKRKSDP